eukprot:8626987-Ditylum_brightwellii.AAC.1
MCATSDVDLTSQPLGTESRTELDSHANMSVVGKHALILSHTGCVADVNPFTPDYKSMRVPIVHAALKYDCPYTGKASILVVHNALHVPNMENNLVPSFMMREVGLQVSDTPKIHMKGPTVDDH